MKRTRALWAAAMTAATIVMLAGYSAAIAQQAEPAPLPLPPAETAETAAADDGALLVVVRDDTGGNRPLEVADADGSRLVRAEAGRPGEYLLELLPARRYRLTAADGLQATFYLEENASVSNVTGDGWSDGEIVHLDRAVRCSLRIFRTAGTEAVYTLTGDDCAETRWLQDSGDGRAWASFYGLSPGTYTLTGSDGTDREVELTESHPELVLGLE